MSEILIYFSDTLMHTAHGQIQHRIAKAQPGSVFVPMDFLDLANRATVDQALGRMVRSGKLRRLARGLYHSPQMNATLGLEVPPHPDQIAQAFGRQTGSRVIASDASVANQMGLSTQVPAQPVYLTDGRSRKVAVGAWVFQFRHVSPKHLPHGDSVIDHAMQVVRYAIDHGLADQVVSLLTGKLNRRQRSKVLQQAKYTGARTAAIARRLVHEGESAG